MGSSDAELHSRLFNKAGALLSRRPYSRGELRLKLATEESPEAVEAVLDRLQELRLLNDAQYAYNFALCRLNNEGWGPIKVKDALLRRHVDPPTADSAIERVHEETNERVLLEQHLQKYFRKHSLPADRRGVARLISNLRNRGFRQNVVYDSLRRLIPASVWSRFEPGE
jgi:regulatory protein